MEAHSDNDGLPRPYAEQIKLGAEVADLLQTDPNPPVYADEQFGGLAYCERKAVYEQQNSTRPDRVDETAKTNAAVKEALPTGLRGLGNETVWRQLADVGHGAYQNVHPVMNREGLYILGCPHLLVFANGQPIRVIRLRGSSEYNLTAEYDNRRIGPWLTCRILDRAGFDTSALAYLVINYSREAYSEENPQLIADIEQIVGDPTPSVDLRNALQHYDDLHVFGRKYDSTEFAALLRTGLRIWNEQQEPEGTDNPQKCETCSYSSKCPDSLV